MKPAGYPIPIDGPVGDLLKAQGRHNMRPAHLHFLIYKPGYKTHISQVYLPDDPARLFESFKGLTAAADQADYRFLRFRPPPAGQDSSLPHIRLDRALQFLLGDRLA